MNNPFLKNIQREVFKWRSDNYQDAEKETKNILSHIKRVGFLHSPQVEALETYIYLKEILNNKPSSEIFKSLFKDEIVLLEALNIPEKEILRILKSDNKKTEIENLIKEKFEGLNYPNQVYALTMGAGKTILMATMMAYDFILSYYHKGDNRFAKNILVFAPDKTIIESLKEIKSFDYKKVVPKEHRNIILNIKYHYLEDVRTALNPIGNFNVVVSNSQKIILKTVHKNKQNLFSNSNFMAKREIENARLQAIGNLEGLAIFIDEAHHSYGQNLEGKLKKVKKTIEYLRDKTTLINAANFTGTPYVKNRMIGDVVYYYGLKQGIEKGILKQVRFSEYSNVKTEKFIQETISAFCGEYGEKKVENKLLKIVFYAASIEDLQKNLRPKLEKILSEKNISIDKILEYHTETEKNRDEFLNLDNPKSEKQFILLVGKGKEGWNCRSLAATALFRKAKSAIFVLQSTTRCLRSIGDNSTKARVFLSSENYKILDRELKNNFATDIEELSGQDQKSIEHILKVEKKKKIKVNKILKEIISVKSKNLSKARIDFKKFKQSDFQSFVSEGGIFLKYGKAGYQKAAVLRKIEEKSSFTFYEIIGIINRHTHLPCADIARILENSGLAKKDIAKIANKSVAIIIFTIKEILANVYEYKEKTEIIEEYLELAKKYDFKINVDKKMDKLVIYREKLEEDEGKGRLGFHINPYNFDSADEKDLFKYLRNILEKDEAIVDIYFTGGVAESSHNDFYFEYWNSEKEKILKYFPDFLIKTTKQRYLVVEVKSSKEELNYKENKKKYKGGIDDLFNNIFAKEIGFKNFQKENKNFEYKIIFNASLREKQQELLEKIKKR